MLQRLRVINWKAYEDRTISFGPGLNLFVGPNGSGKTSLLDAVCLALTGSIPTGDFKSLVRDKSREAEIELELAVGNARYFIKRKFTSDRIIAAELVKNGHERRQPGWDALNSGLANELKTDPAFFSRIIYMSELEVFDYAKNPPSDALNSALERVLGIGSLRAVADFALRLNKNYTKSISTLRNELARSSRSSDEPTMDDEAAREELKRNKADLETAQKEIERAQAELQRLHSISYSLEKAGNVLKAFLDACAELGIDAGDSLATLEGVRKISEIAAENTEGLDQHVRSTAAEMGSIESTLEYLNGIQNLLSSVVQKDASIQAPCPVCERPIDRALATRLAERTNTRLAENRDALAKSKAELELSQRRLQKCRVAAQRLNIAATQLEELQQFAKDLGLIFNAGEIRDLARGTDMQLKEAGEQVKRLTAKSSELSEKVTEGAATIGRIEGRTELTKIRQDLHEQLVCKFKGSMLAETLVSSLHELVAVQRDEGIKPLYLALDELWKRWRPDHDWTITFDLQGRIQLGSTNTNLTFSQLSGGEKTVLLILSRVLLLGLLSQMDFLMIDEPLEHLDLRNRRAVLDFLVASTRCRLAGQAVVTTFEESLVRKYLDGQNTNTTYLAR